MRKHAITCIFVSFLSFCMYGQRTAVYTEANAHFKKGLEFFDLGLYGMAQAEFEEVLTDQTPVNEPEYRIIKTKSELYHARCAVRLDQPDAQKLMLDFVRKNRPDPTANKALLELADYYFNTRKYDEAIEFFAMMNQSGFTEEERTEITFKHAYCLFVKKRFDEAKAKFAQVMNNDGPYYYRSNYYYGMASFYGEDYEEAVERWKIAEQSPEYRLVIPYYIAQVYFTEGRYDDVINYAGPYATRSGVKNRTDLHQLIGQAYFEKGDYESALGFLEYYESQSKKMREEDFYQLGFVQYKNGKYKEAIDNFKQLDKSESELGQSAMFYLADCYLREGDRTSARNAFQKVSRLDFDPKMQEEALFHFAKLSVELHFDRDAVNALQRFQPTSVYYTQAQELLSETLVNTNDYKQAIRIIERLPEQTPRIKEAYQKVTYQQGLKDYTGNNFEDALMHFNKSLSAPVDPKVTALATFWSGEIHFLQKKYVVSRAVMEKFFTQAAGIADLPPSASLGTAYYTQGYNYLKTEDYASALSNFDKSITEIKRRGSGSALLANQVLPDALLRAGDCNFKRNRYSPAVTYYDQAIALQAPGFEYALFQKAIIEGLRGRPSAKINVLNNLVSNYPNASYADDALLEMAETYQGMGQFEQAIYPLDRLVTVYSGRSDLINKAYLKLGLIHYNLGQVNEALASYKKIFENNPTSQEAKDALAAIEEIYVQDLGRPDDYVAFVESIPGYKVSGGERDSLNYQVAMRLYENAEYERATVAFTDYLDKYPNGFHALDAFYNRGESNSILKVFDAALRDYETIISKGQSRYYVPSLEKAALISYNHAEAFEKAFEYYKTLEGLTTEPQVRFEAQLGAMRSAFRIGDMQATETYAAKVASSPSATSEEIAVAKFYRGKIAYQNKRYAQAQAMFEDVVATSNDEHTAEARYLIAEIYYLNRELDAAEEACRTSYTESGSYPYWVARSLILLSDVLVDKGDLFNAKAALEAVIDNFAEDPELVEIAEAKVRQIEAQEAQENRLNTDLESNQLVPLENENDNK